MILVDMDGVLVDLVGPIFALFGRVPSSERWPSYALGEALGVPEADVWARVERGGAGWWEALPPTPWADALDAVLAAAGDRVLVCSSPTLDPACAAGKVAWLQRRYGRRFRDFALTPRKSWLASAGDLVDDSGQHVADHVEAGGRAFLVPQPWNVHGQADPGVAARVEAWLRAGRP